MEFIKLLQAEEKHDLGVPIHRRQSVDSVATVKGRFALRGLKGRLLRKLEKELVGLISSDVLPRFKKNLALMENLLDNMDATVAAQTIAQGSVKTSMKASPSTRAIVPV